MKRKSAKLLGLISFNSTLVIFRHLYSSMEHLTTLLSSSDLDVVLAVLNLLYMFSKRSQFISRLQQDKRDALLSRYWYNPTSNERGQHFNNKYPFVLLRLTHLAASWGGKDSGFGLAKCCCDESADSYPLSATTLHFEFYNESVAREQQALATQAGVDNALMASFMAVGPASSSATSATGMTVNNRKFLFRKLATRSEGKEFFYSWIKETPCF